MKYKDTLVQSLLDWPTLFLNEDDVLNHLFFTIGNGYEWENGQLVSVGDYVPDSRLLFDRANPAEARITNREYRESWLNYPKPIVFVTRNGYIGRILSISEISNFEKIFNLPDDIKPDWLEAAVRALKYARSDRMRKTKVQLGLLKKVSVRIKELRNSL